MTKQSTKRERAKPKLPDDFRPEFHHIRDQNWVPIATLATWRKSDDEVFFGLTIHNRIEEYIRSNGREHALGRLQLRVQGNRYPRMAGMSSLARLKNDVLECLRGSRLARVQVVTSSSFIATAKRVAGATELLHKNGFVTAPAQRLLVWPSAADRERKKPTTTEALNDFNTSGVLDPKTFDDLKKKAT